MKQKADDGKQALRDRLPGASDKSLDAIISALLQRDGSSSEPFTVLLQEGCSPATIHSALIEHRDDALEGGDLSAEELRNVFRHFDRLGFMLLQAVAKVWQVKVSGLESRLALAGTELQLASARTRWARDGEVTLYNYFQEVPIMACVAIHDVRDAGFGVERTADLIQVVAAGQHGRFAHIRLSDRYSCLRLEVESTVGKRVNFKYAGIFKTAQERRQHIRVHCEDTVQIWLTDAPGNRIDAVARDMSQAGFGLEVQQTHSIRIGDPLDFELNLTTGQLRGSCWVRWLSRANTEAEKSRSRQAFGVELDMTPALLRRLQVEVSRRKKRILGELKALGVPDSLI